MHAPATAVVRMTMTTRVMNWVSLAASVMLAPAAAAIPITTASGASCWAETTPR